MKPASGSIGGQVQAARIKRGYSQSELARVLSVDPSFISLIERDKRDPSLATLRRIVDVLGGQMTIQLWVD